MVPIRRWCGCTRKNMGVIRILFPGNGYSRMAVLSNNGEQRKKPIETNGEAYASRFAVDLEYTIVNIIITNAVAIVDMNRYYCDRMADTYRRKGRHFARHDLATAWRRSCWRQRRTRRPAGRPRWISTRPFCQTYDEDATTMGVWWYRVRTATDTITRTVKSW